jgi:DNA-directed RNA polymerase subunit K/omega
MVIRPKQMNSYEFVVVSALRAQQLLAGSVPRMAGAHSVATMAQMEVAGGHIAATIAGSPILPATSRWQL